MSGWEDLSHTERVTMSVTDTAGTVAATVTKGRLQE